LVVIVIFTIELLTVNEDTERVVLGWDNLATSQAVTATVTSLGISSCFCQQPRPVTVVLDDE